MHRTARRNSQHQADADLEAASHDDGRLQRVERPLLRSVEFSRHQPRRRLQRRKSRSRRGATASRAVQHARSVTVARREARVAKGQGKFVARGTTFADKPSDLVGDQALGFFVLTRYDDMGTWITGGPQRLRPFNLTCLRRSQAACFDATGTSGRAIGVGTRTVLGQKIAEPRRILPGFEIRAAMKRRASRTDLRYRTHIPEAFIAVISIEERIRPPR